MKVLLLQLDGKIPNVALMRIAAHHRALGDEIELRRDIGTLRQRSLRQRVQAERGAVDRGIHDDADRIYASLIFKNSRWKGECLQQVRPDALIGGTGWDLTTTLEGIGISGRQQDYSIYPGWKQSVGFTQRGCSLACEFCVVPEKEGKAQPYATIAEIWRGDPCPRELLLLDNDFFARANPWRDRIAEIRDGNFKVSFNQGINARMLNDEKAEALASVRYYDDQMKTRRIYTAWDSREDENTLFRGLQSLVRYGVKPDHIMVYMLIGFWRGETEQDWLYRQQRLRDFGVRPYPMPYVRSTLTIGFQRWVIGAFDKGISWAEWKAARFEPRNLDRQTEKLF